MTDWDQHQAEVAGAHFAIGVAQEAISLVTDRLDSATGAVIMAVGQNPNVESSRNAMNAVAEAKRLIAEAFQALGRARSEVTRYGNGF